MIIYDINLKKPFVVTVVVLLVLILLITSYSGIPNLA